MRGRGKLIAKIVLFAVLFSLCGNLLYALELDDASHYTRVMMHELYGQEDNIDVLFVGSSHCYRSLDTAVTDRMTGMNTFNAGSSAQCLDGSFQLIREAARHNSLKHVYVEMYYVLQARAYRHRRDLTSTYILTDYMRPSLSKYLYLMRASDKAYWFNSFVPARRYWRRLGGVNYLASLLRKKTSAPYRDYSYELLSDDEEAYRGKGYVANFTQNEPGSFHVYNAFGKITENTISEDARDYIRKICDFCTRKGIAVTFFSAPVTDFRLAGVGNYDEYIASMQEILRDSGADYYDFNLCRDSILQLDDTDFKDTDHLNYKGAEKFSRVFASFMTGELTEEELFYGSVKEKMAKEPATVYGLIFEQQGDDPEIRIIPVSNGETQGRITYTIIRRPEGEDASVDQRRSPNDRFRYAEGETGKAHILCYLGEVIKCDIFLPYGQDD